jgi:hypothetical protein
MLNQVKLQTLGIFIIFTWSDIDNYVILLLQSARERTHTNAPTEITSNIL